MVSNSFLFMGHRGYGDAAPENSLQAVRAALADGFDWVELDIQLSKEKIPVVIHDEYLERTTNGRGAVSAQSVPELRRLDAGQGEWVPTLEEVIEVAGGRIGLNLELKAQAAEQLVALLYDFVRQKSCDWQQFIITSFDHRQLQTVHQLCPQVPVGMLVYGVPVSLAADAERIGAQALHVDIEFATAELVTDARQRGLRVIAYTVNRVEELHKAITIGVDGIISDRVTEMKRAYQSAC